VRLLRHRLARTRAAHAEQRKHANEKEATQNRHAENNANSMLDMIAHTTLRQRSPIADFRPARGTYPKPSS
jgi:hypothetical protein